MTAKVFVDTNVLVYCWDITEAAKQRKAVKWLEFLWSTKRGRLSHQVLKEFYHTVTKKLNPGIGKETARDIVLSLLKWQPVEMDLVTYETAFYIQDRFGFSWWDSLIVAAARKSRCAYLLTEDLQEDQSLGEVTVINPFATNPDDIRHP